MKKTLYQILGVHPDADVERIKSAYERLYGGPPGSADPNARSIARDAFEILSDPNRRAAYDARLAAAARPATAAVPDEPGDEPSGLSAMLARPWFKWVAGALVLAAVVVWWKSRLAKQPARAPITLEARPRVIHVIPPEGPRSPPTPLADAQPAQAGPGPAAAATPAAARSGADVFAEATPSVALVTAHGPGGQVRARGSGVVIDREIVLTNCHVTNGASEIQVKVGREILHAIAGLSDEEFDLCRLSVAGLNAPAVTIGSVASLRTGQKVFAIGAPHGLELSLSDGIVSALRAVPGGTVIQTTAPISAGSSGGGLFDESGTLIGITTFQHRYGQNLNFAVPADWIGEMRERKVGAAGSGTLPTGQVSSSPEKVIVGTWLCFGSLTGLNGEFNFRSDGVLLIKTSTERSSGRYALEGRTLRLLGRESTVWGVDSITADKMVFNAGEGRRLVCER